MLQKDTACYRDVENKDSGAITWTEQLNLDLVGLRRSIIAIEELNHFVKNIIVKKHQMTFPDLGSPIWNIGRYTRFEMK